MSYTFISGATGGIGKAFVKQIAKRNQNLFLTGRSQEKLSLLKEELLKEYDIQIEYFPCDITSESDRNEMFSYIDEKGIKFNRLINVAGVDTQKPFIEYTIKKVLFQMRVNVEGTIAITYEFLKRCEENSKIITISSMSGVSPMPYFALYSASKGMLTSFFTALSYELKDKRISVTTVLPGGVPTREDIIKEIKTQGLWGKLSAKTPEFVAEKSIKASNKGKRKYIPGFFNKLLNFFLIFIPKKITLKFIARRWKTHSKDAF